MQNGAGLNPRLGIAGEMQWCRGVTKIALSGQIKLPSSLYFVSPSTKSCDFKYLTQLNAGSIFGLKWFPQWNSDKMRRTMFVATCRVLKRTFATSFNDEVCFCFVVRSLGF